MMYWVCFGIFLVAESIGDLLLWWCVLAPAGPVVLLLLPQHP